MEEFPREIECILESTVEVIKGNSAQAEFKCELKGLKEKYYSLRFIYSDFISGIPTDEILLNPELTDEAINLGELYDYSLQENKGESKIPSTFTTQAIKNNPNDDKLIIEGILNKAINNKLKFKIPLTYPKGASMLCYLSSFEPGPCSIICKVDKNINSIPVIIEQIIITYEKYEILIIKGIISEKNITCDNGLLREAIEKAKVGVTFRQATHLEKNGINEFYFILKAIFSKKYSEEHKVGDYFILNIIVLIGNYAIGKESNCTLIKNVTKNNYILGNFRCATIVSEEEYKKIDFKKKKSITISPYNPNITSTFGIDKNKLSPSLKLKNSTISNNIKLGFPTFKPEKLEIEECWKKGKFIILGTTVGKLEEKTFEFPLTYPSVSIRCKLEEIEFNVDKITCKLGKEFIDENTLVIESRLVTKMHKEILFIEKKIFTINNISSCKNYNKIKFEKAKKNQNASFSFLTISEFNSLGKFTNFFIGMVRKPNETFAEIKIPINIGDSKKSLRQLEQLTNCNIAIQKGTAVFYECMHEKEISSKSLKISIDYDNIKNIAGLPENFDQSNLKLDYSNRDNLDVINTIPTINITNITHFNCNDDGNFIIDGIIKNKKSSKKIDNVEIQFSYPDSSSICEIEFNFSKVIMDCKNKEKFPISTIMFDQTYVKDNEGNILFKLNNYINQKQFGCEVGILNSDITQASKKKSLNKVLTIILSSISSIIVVTISIIIIKLLCNQKKEDKPDTPNLDSDNIEPISSELEKESSKTKETNERKNLDDSNYAESASSIILKKNIK